MTDHDLATSNGQPPAAKSDRPSGKQLLLGLIFGIMFGFLLQKGGVGKYHILIGSLLLEDYTVIKVMLTAIIVGMIGVHLLHAMGQVKLHIKPTRYLANAIGGLLFGVGFALSAYCPGTSVAALGQGSFDAAATMTGLVIGSYLFALASGWVERTINPIGDRGKITLYGVLRVKKIVFISLMALALAAVLFALEKWVKPLSSLL